MSTVRKEALALSPAKRLRLVEDLWDSLAATPDAVPVTEAQRKELTRRRRVHAQNPEAVTPWARVRGRLGRSQ